jgi:hypothetical protein
MTVTSPNFFIAISSFYLWFLSVLSPQGGSSCVGGLPCFSRGKGRGFQPVQSSMGRKGCRSFELKRGARDDRIQEQWLRKKSPGAFPFMVLYITTNGKLDS